MKYIPQRGSTSSKVSPHLCYLGEPAGYPFGLQSSSYSRRQRPPMSVLPFSPPQGKRGQQGTKICRTTAQEKNKKTLSMSNANSGAANRYHRFHAFHILVNCYTICLLFSPFIDSGICTAAPPPPRPLSSSFSSFLVASSFACRNQLVSLSTLCHLTMKPPAALTIPPVPLASLFSLRGP